jgi:hypothetical protein
MNYDEYIDEVQKYSSDDAVSRFVAHLNNWKSNESNVIDLADSIEKFFGNSWITSEDTHSHLYQIWSSFKDAKVSGIGGMTMNERLYMFGLFERFDTCKTDTEKQVIYAKLYANT